MSSLDTIILTTGSYGPFIAIAIATFLAFEALFLMIARRRRQSGSINSRLRVLEGTGDRQAALIELRHKRGLTTDGGYRLPIDSLNRLLLQSGVTVPQTHLFSMMAALSFAAAFVTYLLLGSAYVATAAAAVVGFFVPLLVLTAKRMRRLRQLEYQLPEAVDVMVRSLRAGHPIPVSIALVAQELPDPVGSEFGMVSDEMTYGLDLATAMSNLRARTGQSDVALLVVAISIQSKTGGNLAELLANLGRMIRERGRMRRKIHSLSAEGRMSAVALSFVPLGVYLIVNTISPSFYGDVNNDSWFMPAAYLGLTLWVIGVYSIRRLVNFKV